MKAIVVYYSFSGKTEIVAKAAAGELGANILKIGEAKPRSILSAYTSGGAAAMNDKSSEIKPFDFKAGDYDLILVGTPVWAGKPAPAINAFISQTDFNGKNVVVFCTAGGRGTASTIKSLTEKIEKKGGKVTDSFSLITGRIDDEELVQKTKEAVRKYVSSAKR